MCTFDNQEDLVTAGAAIALTSGVLGDAASGVGDGASRSDYYCRGIHNFGSSGVTVAYNLIRQGVADTSHTFKVYIGAGSTVNIYDNVGQIAAATTNPSSLKLFYKEREIVDMTQPSGYGL
jgi:hypothetical protein